MSQKTPSALPQPRPAIATLSHYQASQPPGNSAEYMRLNQNEGALGPSPKAIEAYQRAAKEMWHYPQARSVGLAMALGRHYGLDWKRILIGNGSDELILHTISTFVGVGDEVIVTQYAFTMFTLSTKFVGGTVVVAPDVEFTVSVDAILERVTERTKLVFLANPNNPTGTYLSVDEVRRLHDGLPSDVVLVLDAAYAEYCRRNDYSAGIDMVEAHDNVLMLRTFSKLYAMAGLRLGWCYGSAHLIDALGRGMGPFNVNGAAQAAGEAALGDADFLDRSLAHNDEWLPWIQAELEALGIVTFPTVANFFLVRMPAVKGMTAAETTTKAIDFLKERKILVREMASYKLPDHFRVSVGPGDQLKALVQGLKDFLS
ncbi:MAG: aminotransferase class I/II-fold pyridoxal phosphate-dependent enzyme [Alphaproteobacteria bacterium]|nr:aminotransferase class I/II-fold pyridoxal phosphate-dependent enzyme [Alphaproteobacteria bacterium]